MAGSSTSTTYSNGLMTPASNQGPSRGLQLPSRNLQLPSRNLQLPSKTPQLPSKNLQLPSKNLQLPTTQRLITPPPAVTSTTSTSTTTTTTGIATPTPTAGPVNAPRSRSRSRKRPRSIACVTCNKQKKTCGPSRPCPRCLHLNIPCRQPIKPEGFLYNTKKQKIADPPPSPPVSPDDHNVLMVALKKAAEIHRQLPRPCLVQGLPPSPSPSTSTVGTPLYSCTSTSSYDDPAIGKNSDTIELNSCINSHSVSPINGTPIDETPKSLPIPDMSRWSLPALPAPAEEVPYDIVKNSIFNGAPVLGLEKSTYDYDISGDDIFTGFGEPTDLADVYADVMDSMGIQGIKERGEDCGDEKGKHGAEVEHVLQGEHVVAAGPTTSGIAPETCVSGTAWLDEADLLADSLALDDVDLSNLDIPGLDDIVIDSDMEQLFESISKSTPPTLSESLPPRP